MIPAMMPMQQGMTPLPSQFYPPAPSSPLPNKGGNLQPLPVPPKTQSAPSSAGYKPGGTLTSTSGLDQSDNIKVVVRVRPLLERERENAAANVIYVSEDDAALKVVVSGPGGATMQRDFQFHACLGPETQQHNVMELCGIFQLIDAALSGYNVTIFAYGQTGSGKTYTMSGREEVIGDDGYTGDHHHDGIITRAVNYIFQAVQSRKDSKVNLSTSYLEIYNEGIYDLINFKQRNLPVKWDANQGFYVPGLKIMQTSNINTVLDVIRTGMKHRRVGSHELNIESSRSHSIFTIYCDTTPVDQSSYDYGSVRYGKISFVDLAGSERLKDSKSEGQMLKETTNINKSLFVLGKVISALAERDSNGTSAHIPYRDSKLTKLLMDSLGGSALALMIACCSPSSQHVEETLSTLTYATRAKNIQNRPTVQYDPKEAQLALLRRELDLLRQENQYLKEQLKLGSTISSFPQTPNEMGQPPGSAQGFPAPATPARNTSPTNEMMSASFQAMSGWRPPVAGNPTWPKLAGGQVGTSGMLAAGSLPSPTALGPQGLPLHDWRQLEPLRSFSSGSQNMGLPVGSELRPSPSREFRGGNLATIEAEQAGSKNGRRSSIDDQELIKRLKETQQLLARFSEENARLASDNFRLQSNRQMLSNEHATVLDEIDSLRGKLSMLEHSVKTGSQPIGQAKALLNSYKTNLPGGNNTAELHLPPPNYTPPNGQRPPMGYAAMHQEPGLATHDEEDEAQEEDDEGPEDLGMYRPPPRMPPPAPTSTSPLKMNRAGSGGGAGSPGPGGPGAAKARARKEGDDGIIVADKSKLSLLFDEGGDTASVTASLDLHPVPPHMRPVPQKPPPGQSHYANPLKESYEQDRLKKATKH